MSRSVSLQELIEIVYGDQEIVHELLRFGLLEEEAGGFDARSVDRALTCRTLYRELEVNWAGIEIILRMREELLEVRRRLAEDDDDKPSR